jgi:prepilin-type N-terminal cleavage/methylation domain-containing protein
MNEDKFTLIELLVVVAIIGILVSLLMPSLKSARAKAKVAVCASNLKQISFAFAKYVSNHNGQIPGNYDYGSGSERTWDDHLADYDGREVSEDRLKGWIHKNSDFEQYVCPADESTVHSSRHKRSYSITLGVKNPNANTKRGIAASTGSGWTMNMLRIEQPSDTLAIVERHDPSNKLGCNGGDTVKIAAYQSNQDNQNFWGHGMWRSNYLLIDGSVRFLSAESTFKGVRSIWGSQNEDDTMWDSRR